MSKRTKIQIGTFLSALFLVLGGLAITYAREAADYRRYLSNSRQHAFAELAAQIEGLNSALQKGQYATSSSLLSSLCTEIYGRATAAQMALGELPYSNVELEQTAAFLAKAGDYAWALSRSVSGTVSPTAEQRETLAGLATVSVHLAQRLENLQEQFVQKGFSLEDVRPAEEALAGNAHNKIPAGSAFQAVEEEFPELPTLIYDGPFSEHLTAQSQKYLAEKPDFSPEEAKRQAASFLDRPEKDLVLVSSFEGTLPGYGFSLATERENLYLEVSRQGGVVTQLISSHSPGQAQVLPQTALSIAKGFLLEHGYENMEETYFIRQGAELTVNFAYRDNDILCYPDLIKVTVSLDVGEVISFDATGFLTCHTSRTYTPVSVPADSLLSSIPSELTVLTHQLTLIPTSGQTELLCHEFKCQTENGTHILLYFNAQTGEEEKILLLLEDENGTLVK